MNPTPDLQPGASFTNERATDRNAKAAQAALDAKPWWRVPMVWVVVSGPLSVVVASLATAVIAWKHIDPVISDSQPAHVRAGDDVPSPSNPKDSMAPALKARNHAATPAEE